MSYIVYYHQNKINGKVYVGCTSQTANNRFRKNGQGYFNGYRTLGEFQGDILKFGWDNFDHVIAARGLSKDDAFALEAELVKKFDAHVSGYNKTDGGLGSPGIVYGPSEIERRREYMRKRIVSEETRKKQSQAKKNFAPWNKGKKASDNKVSVAV